MRAKLNNALGAPVCVNSWLTSNILFLGFSLKKSNKSVARHNQRVLNRLLIIQTDVEVERRVKVLQQVMLGVFLGEDGLVGRDAPVDAQRMVEDADASVGFGVVEGVALVLENGDIAENGKAVGETSGHEELAVVVLGQLDGHVLAVGGTALADVDGYVEHGATDTAHELALGERGALEVEPAHDTIDGAALVVLYKVDGAHLLVELTL